MWLYTQDWCNPRTSAAPLCARRRRARSARTTDADQAGPGMSGGYRQPGDGTDHADLVRRGYFNASAAEENDKTL